jgi:protein phosphatase 2C family protein 2/3
MSNPPPFRPIVRVVTDEGSPTSPPPPLSLVGNAAMHPSAVVGRRRSQAVRATSLLEMEREPLLSKANREEHYEALAAPGFRMAVSNIQGWRKENEDAHCLLAQFVIARACERRAPGLHGPQGRASPSPPASIGDTSEPQSSSASPNASVMHSPESKASSPSMPDVVLDESPVIGFLGVFDGHHGRAAADYVASHLAALISESLRKLHPDATPEDERRAISSSFELCDETMRASGKAGESGSTAGVIIVLEDRVHMCNVGDCKLAAVTKEGDLLASIDNDHSPLKNSDECARLSAANIAVINGRVNGEIAITRALGDYKFKPATQPASQHALLCLPEITTVPRKDLSTAVVGCDGVWELHDLCEVARQVATSDDFGGAVTSVAHTSCATIRPLNQVTKVLSPGSDNVTFAAILFDL